MICIGKKIPESEHAKTAVYLLFVISRRYFYSFSSSFFHSPWCWWNKLHCCLIPVNNMSPGISSIFTMELTSIKNCSLIAWKLQGNIFDLDLALLLLKPIQRKTLLAHPLLRLTDPLNSFKPVLLRFSIIPLPMSTLILVQWVFCDHVLIESFHANIYLTYHWGVGACQAKSWQLLFVQVTHIYTSLLIPCHKLSSNF